MMLEIRLSSQSIKELNSFVECPKTKKRKNNYFGLLKKRIFTGTVPEYIRILHHRNRKI